MICDLLGNGSNLQVREDKLRGVVLPELTEHVVTSVEQVILI